MCTTRLWIVLIHKKPIDPIRRTGCSLSRTPILEPHSLRRRRAGRNVYMRPSDKQQGKNLLHFSFSFSFSSSYYYFLYMSCILLLLLFNDIFSSDSVLPDLAGKLTGTGFFFLPVKSETMHVYNNIYCASQCIILSYIRYTCSTCTAVDTGLCVRTVL